MKSLRMSSNGTRPWNCNAKKELHTGRQEMDGIDGLDIAGHVLNPLLQIIGGVVGDVVLLGAIGGHALHNVELCLGAWLVHQVVAEDGGVLPEAVAHTGSAIALCNAQ